MRRIMGSTWHLEPRFNSRGSRFMLVDNFLGKHDTSRLPQKLVDLNRKYPEMILDCAQLVQLDHRGAIDIVGSISSLGVKGTRLVIVNVPWSFRHIFQEVLSITYSKEVCLAEKSA